MRKQEVFEIKNVMGDVRVEELAVWKRLTKEGRKAKAFKIASQVAFNNPSDPFSFNRVYSLLINQAATPQDFAVKV